MKQIITVLAILISGIASAQNWDTSLCGEELLVISTDTRYQTTEALRTQISSGNGLRDSRARAKLLCLDNGVTIRGSYGRYFLRYLGATRFALSNGSGNEYRNFPNNSAVIWAYNDHPNPDRNGKFEIRVFSNGSAASPAAPRRFNNAVEAWERANGAPY